MSVLMGEDFAQVRRPVLRDEVSGFAIGGLVAGKGASGERMKLGEHCRRPVRQALA
jgi:hypothetical protein